MVGSLALSPDTPVKGVIMPSTWRSRVDHVLLECMKILYGLRGLKRGLPVELYSGTLFYPLDPKPGDLLITDIAHALSNLCRYGGHCRKFYSVAEHSVICWELAVKENGHGDLAKAVLMHDASEAIVQDLIRPVKQLLFGYRALENRVHGAVNKRFGIQYDRQLHSLVKQYDNRVMLAEGRQLMASKAGHWNYGNLDTRGITFDLLSPWMAKERFLRAYSEEFGIGY